MNMDVGETLFPFQNSVLNSQKPIVYIILQRKRSVIDNILGTAEERDNIAVIEKLEKK